MPLTSMHIIGAMAQNSDVTVTVEKIFLEAERKKIPVVRDLSRASEGRQNTKNKSLGISLHHTMELFLFGTLYTEGLNIPFHDYLNSF